MAPWLEYGLTYAAGSPARRFADPRCAIACTLSGRLFGLDSQSPGLILLDRSGSVSTLFCNYEIESAAPWSADDCVLVVNGEIVIGEIGSGLNKVLRPRSHSGRAYRHVSTHAASNTIAALDVDGAAELVTSDGRIVRRIRDRALADDAIAVLNSAREGLCIVYERANILRWYGPDAEVVRQVGNIGAEYVPEGLFAPKGAAESDQGVLIADSYNNRVVCVSASGRHVWTYGSNCTAGGADGLLWRPVSVASTSEQEILVADSKNGRFVLIDAAGRRRQVWGNSPIESSELRLPRSVSRQGSSGLIVSDTHNDRLVRLSYDADASLGLDSVSPTKYAWPRCAVGIGNRLWVSEGRGNRIRIGTKSHHVFSPSAPLVSKWALSDPHEIIEGESGQVIITDTGHDNVIELDSALRARSLFDVGLLSDPHSACFTSSGALAVADTGNNRLIIRSKNGSQRELTHIQQPDGGSIPLRGVRHCSVWNNRLLLTITDLNTVALCDEEGVGIWAFGPTRLHPEATARSYFFRDSFLHGPKWASGVTRSAIAIGDTGNSRILVVRPHLDCVPHRTVCP